ncbi:MAG: indolepyruvate oxidoreductase subunit beta [Clostridia bacterium]
MTNLNVMMVGVGGQGTLLASRVLGNVALRNDFDVKVSEVHGMSQRGGSVVTYVKMGKKVYSPLIEIGEADVIMAFETLEALRWVGYLKKGGTMLVNTQRIDPMPVITGNAKYPEEIIETLALRQGEIVAVDALEIAKKCGSIKAVNVVLIGMMAARTEIPKEQWIEALKEIVPAKVLDLNLNAFDEGYLL